MIVFTKLRYKNFLSTGDNFTELELNKSKSTLVVGQNGAGKSTMLDALSFALFGKAHRNINKNQMINSINGKGMQVEVEFEIGVSKYKIIRGAKPTKFEIWKNDVLVNQDSHNKEYQKLLEQNILKLNHKSFHQIVVLGSSSFIPFMQLTGNHRREVIEDLLDINVFSKMNGLLKERVSVLREQDRANKGELELIEEKISTQKKYLKKLHDLNKSQKNEKLEEIQFLRKTVDELNSKMSSFEMLSTDPLNDKITALNKKVREFEKYDHQFGVKQKELNKEIKFYEKNDTCPSCNQNIEEELKKEKTESASKKWDELEEARHEATGQITSLNQKLSDLQEEMTRIQEEINKESALALEIKMNQNRINVLQEEIVRIETETGSIEEAQEQYEVYTEKKEVLTNQRLTIVDDVAYNTVITELLKDTGIKTKIIKQYLPVINNLVNKYLQVLDFYVSFHLDDTFKESIRSRHRDDFSYDSFSEGEKQRIDLALLFTWRQVAKMKNSVATNLLILDETFDSSLDAEGVDNLTQILDTLDNDTSVFIISHKGELLDGKFEDKIEFVKSRNFSKVA
jgi:DNA repair exonuclease SbcCD ATPase subunit